MDKKTRFIRMGSQFLDLSARVARTLWENMALIIGYGILMSGLSWVWMADSDKTSETIPLSSNLGEVIVIDPLVQSLQDKVSFEVKDETQFSKISFSRTFLGTIDAKNMKVGIIGVTKEGVYYLCKTPLVGPFSPREALFQQIGAVQIKDNLAEISLERSWVFSIFASVVILIFSLVFLLRAWE